MLCNELYWLTPILVQSTFFFYDKFNLEGAMEASRRNLACCLERIEIRLSKSMKPWTEFVGRVTLVNRVAFVGREVVY